MHDPDSLLWDVKIPIPFRAEARKNWCGGYINLFQVWHRDPCTDGSDDSCGRYCRARHGVPGVVEETVKQLEWDWDSTFQMSEDDDREDADEYGHAYTRSPIRYTGLFKPDGTPLMSTIGIVTWIYFNTLIIHYKRKYSHDKARRKTYKYINKHIAEIITFAENPTDSLHSSITNVFGNDIATANDKHHQDHLRKQRISSLVSAVYGSIIRDIRPWYKNPALHVHHWRLSGGIFSVVRNLFMRCNNCRKRMWKKERTYNWGGDSATCADCHPVQKYQVVQTAV